MDCEPSALLALPPAWYADVKELHEWAATYLGQHRCWEITYPDGRKVVIHDAPPGEATEYTFAAEAPS